VMAVLRILGFWLVVAALAAGVINATHTAESWDITATSLGDLWGYAHPGSLDSVRTSVQQYLPTHAWDPALLTLLRTPAWLIAAILGLSDFISLAPGTGAQR
jgi:hypothetical protein